MDNFLGDLLKASPAGIAAGIFPYIELYGQALIVLGTLIYLGLGIYSRYKSIKENKHGSE